MGLIEVDVDEMHIVAAKGPGNHPLAFSRETALGLLGVLEATADDVEAFSSVGAFGVSLDETPVEADIRHAGCDYSLWCFPDHERIAVRRTELAPVAVPAWSLFRRLDSEICNAPYRLRRRLLQNRPTRVRGERTSRPFEDRSLGTWDACCQHDGAMSTGELTDLLIRCPEIARKVNAALASAALGA